MPFILKMIILPRQARDKHRENSKKDAFLQELTAKADTKMEAALASVAKQQAMAGAALSKQIETVVAVRQTPLWASFMLTTIVLPRQARDKHRESSKKEWRFPAGREGGQELTVVARSADRRRNEGSRGAAGKDDRADRWLAGVYEGKVQ